ncbi:MATE family efflux transporter [Rhizobium sp. SSA_523]|uniref:MATE family efflux transporter n=1 Tax=Rhizobium sp. SSA_523 TaxID=2952477 RepID=UPI0020910E7D|nr:MATE family efflux transporter [Rhizobium sp. SSA_523]MCO5730367.1 MATE family efflux transporter [Rhizobium sp. SSA_523]WKC25411.1 MATE family efflux transporter [Rhizobium sp. SSA_523]
MAKLDAARLASANNGWGAHIRGTLLLGLPFVGAQLAQMAINTTDVIMVGWLGTTQLAAVVLATQMFFVVLIFGTGFSNAVVPLVAQAIGRGDAVQARRSVRMGMWVVIAYGVLTAPLLWFSKPILLSLGQDPEVSSLAEGYLRILQWGMFPALLLMVLRAFVSALERGGIVLYVTIGMFLLNAVLDYGLIFGHFGLPQWGLQGAAIASLGSNLLGLALIVLYIESREDMRGYELFVRFWRPDWVAFREILSVGLPISFTILAEAGLFSAASLLMGLLGTQELAAHGIALQLASIAFMIPLGLAQVASVRVGIAHGRGDPLGVRRAAIAVLVIGMCIAAMGSALFALIPGALGRLFLDTTQPDAQEVLLLSIPLIVAAGAFQMFDGLQAVAAGLLRGLKDTKIPMILALIAYWPIGFFCAWLFGFALDLRGPGIWIGFVTGLMAAAIMLSLRFWFLVRRA